ncbi:hypothetical protein OG320_00355 [Microbispora sp. NBC_01189]|nr:hypothetical protein OG320_00355 [Microbispora sp. NBC_01189]
MDALSATSSASAMRGLRALKNSGGQAALSARFAASARRRAGRERSSPRDSARAEA